MIADYVRADIWRVALAFGLFPFVIVDVSPVVAAQPLGVAPVIDLISLAANALAAPTSEVAPHLQQNPVYRELVEIGVTCEDRSLRLPLPTVPDGLDEARQVSAIEQLGGARYSFDKFTRRSVVAPHITRVPGVPSTDAPAPLRTVDAWFVVYSDLDAVSDRDFLNSLLTGRHAEGEASGLKAAQLQARGIKLDADRADHESFGHLTYDLLDRVRISATGRSFWSRTDESIVVAVKVDRRFMDDEEFPNQWRPIQRAAGEMEVGPAKPYEGWGLYLKMTRLRKPSDALLVELHMAFAEPVEWFRGTNQLGAKLPAALQSQIREARREMMRASRSRGD